MCDAGYTSSILVSMAKDGSISLLLAALVTPFMFWSLDMEPSRAQMYPGFLMEMTLAMFIRRLGSKGVLRSDLCALGLEQRDEPDGCEGIAAYGKEVVVQFICNAVLPVQNLLPSVLRTSSA